MGASVGVLSAAGIGLFPEALLSKYETLGNSSLLGDIEFIMNQDEETLQEIKDNSKVVILATDPKFEQLFLENLHL